MRSTNRKGGFWGTSSTTSAAVSIHRPPCQELTGRAPHGSRKSTLYVREERPFFLRKKHGGSCGLLGGRGACSAGPAAPGAGDRGHAGERSAAADGARDRRVRDHGRPRP